MCARQASGLHRFGDTVVNNTSRLDHDTDITVLENDNASSTPNVHQRPLTAPVSGSLQRSVSDSGVSDSGDSVATHSAQPVRKLNELAACCHSLGNAGFADSTLDVINQHILASRRWHQSLVDFLRSTECRRFFPNGLPSVQNLHRLAVFHNKPVRPPKRFICSVHSAHARKRTPHVFREAFAHSQTLQRQLASHGATFDIHALLSTDLSTSIEHLTAACPPDDNLRRQPLMSARLSIRAKLSRKALASLLQPEAPPFERESILSLIDTLEQCLRFANHTHYQQMLGELFLGVQTHWQMLNQQIGFSQSLLDVLEDHAIAGDIIAHWDTECEAFYQLSRYAALVSRRMKKLNRLVQRISPCELDTETYLSQSAKAIERLSLWRDIVAQTADHSDVTPRQLLKVSLPDRVPLVELTP